MDKPPQKDAKKAAKAEIALPVSPFSLPPPPCTYQGVLEVRSRALEVSSSDT